MIKTIARERIDEDLYLVLKTIYHYERMIAMRYSLDFEQIYILQYLRRHAVARVTELSIELQLPMFAVSRQVNRLAQGGYLNKEKDIKDRRNVYLHLEKKGLEMLKEIEKTSFERIDRNTASLQENEIKELLRLAEQLHIILGVTENVIK